MTVSRIYRESIRGWSVVVVHQFPQGEGRSQGSSGELAGLLILYSWNSEDSYMPFIAVSVKTRIYIKKSITQICCVQF